MKTTNNPMNQARVEIQLTRLRAADRCGAKTRAGGTCQCPAIRGRARCRIHGGRSTGAPKGSRNGNYVDGTGGIGSSAGKGQIIELLSTNSFWKLNQQIDGHR